MIAIFNLNDIPDKGGQLPNWKNSKIILVRTIIYEKHIRLSEQNFANDFPFLISKYVERPTQRTNIYLYLQKKSKTTSIRYMPYLRSVTKSPLNHLVKFTTTSCEKYGE